MASAGYVPSARRLKSEWLEGELPNGIFGLRSAGECAPLQFDTSLFDFYFWDFSEESAYPNASDTTRKLKDTNVSDLSHLP